MNFTVRLKQSEPSYTLRHVTKPSTPRLESHRRNNSPPIQRTHRKQDVEEKKPSR
ncbi:unnamed protein product [Brassica rapa subsp. trilocularis]